MSKDEAIAWAKGCEDRLALRQVLEAIKDRLFILTHAGPAGVGNKGVPYTDEIPDYSGPRP